MPPSLNPSPFVIRFDTITLRDLEPVLNGVVLAGARVTVLRDDPDEILLSFGAPALGQALFLVTVGRAGDSLITLRCAIEDLPPDFVLDSFGIHFGRVENARAFLRAGYFSWDGSEYLPAEAPRPVTGYAMTQLLPRDGGGSLVIGFDRHDRFQHTFTFANLDASLSLTIESLWDRKARLPNESCASETLVLFEHPGVEDALREWAKIVAAQSPVPPRHVARITGWCSWYNLYASITEENILEHLRGVREIVRREHLPMRVFQIDDGFTPEMGDWLEVKPQFPRGMKPLLDEIRAAGFIPGLWIAPFMVGNRSHLFRDHPDWVVRERASGEPLAQLRFYGEFRWHKRSEEYYILDTTHPGAFEYLRSVFRVWRKDWGCEYFKTDFMQFGSEHGAARALYHTPGMTRIEIWRRVAEMVRAEIGDALWLGCGCPLWAAVGLVDAVRIGRDVGVAWNGERPAQTLLRDVAARSFANGILWQADPDCILLRERFHALTGAEVRSLALFGGLLGGVLMTSDSLHELVHPHDEIAPYGSSLTPENSSKNPNAPPQFHVGAPEGSERLRLWKFLLDLQVRSCRFPLLGDLDDPLLVLVCDAENFTATFFLNPGETPVTQTYAWQTLSVPPPRSLYDWTEDSPLAAPPERITVTLAPHESKLWLLERG